MLDKITRAQLIPVASLTDTPNMGDAINVQFNPSSLKVGLANTLKPPKRGSSSKSSQFVDKSSSNLTIELLFDTTLEDVDVRTKTKVIAEKFMKPIPDGDKLKAPSRCRFQWGAFAFVGMVQSYDETLDFFSPTGTPLRATLSLKLTEDKFQFITNAATKAARNTPKLTSSGSGNANNTPESGGKSVQQANQQSGKDSKEWRDTAMYNGIENPRFPPAPAIMVPGQSAAASVGTSIGGSINSAVGESVNTGFSYGASTSLGTGIEGAFNSSLNGNRDKMKLANQQAGLSISTDARGKISIGIR